MIITITTPTHTPAEKISPIAWHEFNSIDKRITVIVDLIADIVIILMLLNKQRVTLVTLCLWVIYLFFFLF